MIKKTILILGFLAITVLGKAQERIKVPSFTPALANVLLVSIIL